MVIFIKFKGDGEFKTTQTEIDSMFNYDGYYDISFHMFTGFTSGATASDAIKEGMGNGSVTGATGYVVARVDGEVTKFDFVESIHLLHRKAFVPHQPFLHYIIVSPAASFVLSYPP